MGTPRQRTTRAGILAVTALAATLLAVPQDASAASSAKIDAIQGTTRLSPYQNRVMSTSGIVTAVRSTGSSRGFWLQDPNPDGDPATSEGIFVYNGSTTPAVSVGDQLNVTGTVSEYYPGGSSSGVQSVTELTYPKWTTVSSGNALPAPFVLDDASVPDAYTPTNGGNSIEGLTLQPGVYALDRYESLEGMRVEVDDARVVGPTNAYGELWVTAKPNQNPSIRGGTVYGSYSSQNSGRIQVQSLGAAPPAADVGQTLSGATVGPLDYNEYGGAYTIAAVTLGSLTGTSPARETTTKQSSGELAVATYNVENLDPTDPQSKFDRLAAGIVTNLASPDIVALEEVQDNDGATDDGVVACDQTMSKLISAISAAGGPSYAYQQIDPVNDSDGGEPGGNIRQAFLYNPARVGFTYRAGGDATTAVSVVDNGGTAALSVSPGRIDPTNSAWNSSRKPLAGEFTFGGRTFFVIANHFNSKGGDQGLDSADQPPTRSSETQRTAQATIVNTFVKQVQAVQPDAAVVVVGDLNDFTFSQALSDLTAGGVLDDLPAAVPTNEQYTYVYQGNSQVLDHILLSPSLSTYAYDIVHVNAEFADQASDHDPQVVRITP